MKVEMNVTHPNYGQNYRLTRAVLRIGDFTVSELQSLSGAGENTVYSFIDKLEAAGPGYLKSTKLGSEGPGRPGRPRKRYSLTEAGAAYLTKRSIEMARRFGEAKSDNNLPNPVVEAVSLQERLDPIFSQPSVSAAEFLTVESFSPRVDVYEHGEDLVVQAEIPGIAEKDLDLRIENNVLIFSGERKIQPQMEKLRRVELRYGRFSRSFILPATIDPERIRAEYVNGLLRVTIPQPSIVESESRISGEVPSRIKEPQLAPVKLNLGHGVLPVSERCVSAVPIFRELSQYAQAAVSQTTSREHESVQRATAPAVVLATGVKLPIYMDNHATTPMDPRVLEEMLPYFMEKFGNAASRNHSFGWAAEEGVETARERIAKLIGATTKEIIFTSGATESDNLAIKGVAEMYREKGNHIITAVTEHKAVLDTCKRLEKYGYRVTYLPVQKDGLIDQDNLKRALDDKTILVTIMAANNEIGVLQPFAEIGKLCRERGVIFHTDATQAVGKIRVDVNKQNIDLMSITGHKMYGPKGVGALYVRRKNPRVQISAIIDGGGHERGMRSGTLNVPGIVGLGKACAIASEEMSREAVQLAALRDRLRGRIMNRLDETYINGTMEHRLPGNLNISFAYVDGESLLMGINDIAVSSGPADTSATLEPSYVLKALGTGDGLADSSIRFGIGRFNTAAEVDYVADRVVETVERLRKLSPLYEMAKEGIDLNKIQWEADKQ